MDFREALNRFGKARRPCFFIINFNQTEAHVLDLADCKKAGIYYAFGERTNVESAPCKPKKEVRLDLVEPPSLKDYAEAFSLVQDELKAGNTYLLNLTFGVRIACNLDLEEIFFLSQAAYKIFFQDRFVVFSPERFVTIKDNRISTFPMKGTCLATGPEAAEVLLKNPKEEAEHITVVDLLRNDLGMVGRNVRVRRFRYLDLLKTSRGPLYQVSSEITAELEPDWPRRLGDIVARLLPAGSVTGAPKKKTVAIIKAVENYERGFYTGIAGLFDGQSLDSAVLIRFIERKPDQSLIYKSGGGITIESELEAEYQELLAKVYVPIA